jgi:hemolysin activation/secretion protein
MFFGASSAIGFSWGLDPDGTRSWGALRLEGAGTSTNGYGRTMLDASFAQGLGSKRAVTITGAAGTSAGELPLQRRWFVGGPYTVRGHRPGTMAGDSFWLGRVELTQGHPMIRPVLFGDIGWAGSRESWSDVGRPLSGAGLGAAFLDGIVRVDVARGLNDSGRWRLDAYFEIR